VDLEAYERAGLYDPDAPDAAERQALLEWLERHGTTVSQMQRSAKSGSLSSAAGDALLNRPGAPIGVDELAARAGLDTDQVFSILEAAGATVPAGAEQTFVESDVETFQMFAAGVAIFDPEAILDITRVMGNAMARVAEAAITLFQVEVEGPMAEREAGALAHAEANLDAVTALEVLPRVMGGLFRLHIETAIRRSRDAYDVENPYGSRRLAVGFIDLVGFTPLSMQLDNAKLAEMIDGFERRANEIVTQHDGRVVKHIGDEVMFVAVGASAACRIALAACQAFRDADVEPHGGLAIGGLVTRGGDFYGPIVNLASRIGDIAVPNEILVTEDVMRGAADDAQLTFEPAGRRMLKGFDEPVALWSLS
jgi:Adenylate cyclase, family 3 (some proteins contain HAMP domain)